MLVMLLPFAIATTKSFRWFEPQTEAVALTKIIGPHVCSGQARFTFTRTRAPEAVTAPLSVPDKLAELASRWAIGFID
jgi:hypothetical protein